MVIFFISFTKPISVAAGMLWILIIYFVTDSGEGLRNACKLLGLDEDSVVRTLTIHTINVSSGGQVSVLSGFPPLSRKV